MSFASPGGIRLSSAKKRRLSALDEAANSTSSNAKGANRKQPVQATKGAKASAQASVQGLGYKAAAEQATTEPQYLMLDPSILAGPLPQAVPALRSNADASVNLIMEEAMQTNTRVPDAQAAIASRVHNKVLMLDNPTANLLTKVKKASNQKRIGSRLLPCSKRPKIVSGQCKYNAMEPLHKLWTQYIAGLLRDSANKEALLLDADYHGCKLTVQKCPNSRHVGVTGYMITDTAKAFAILTKDDRLHHVPKKDTVFQFTLADAHQVTLLGSQLLKHRA